MFISLFSLGVAGFIAGMLLISALLKHINKSHADYMLIALLSFLVAEIFIHYIWPGLDKFSSVTEIPIFINLLFAPVLLFFLKNQYAGDVFSRRLLLHFLFFGCFQGMVLLVFFIFPYLHLAKWCETVLAFDKLGDTLLLAVYVVLCMRILFTKRFSKKSNFKQRVVHITLVAILCIYFLISCAVDMQHMPVQQYILNILYGLLASSLLVMSYVFLCAVVPVCQKQDPVLDCQKEKYGNNRLPDFIKNLILNDLNHCMREKRPWIDFNLRLGGLAECINVNPHQLSQIINAELGKSFACYVNEFRVKNACELLVVDAEKSVTDIALESGFSSKSSFNTIFKKQTGLTPSEYRKNFGAPLIHNSFKVTHTS
jgi:AraC-like DNA-binding protein